MMFLASSILIGFLRFCFILLFFFYLNGKIRTGKKPVHFLNFIILNWFKYGAILIVLIFILVQINAYNLFNCFLFLSLIIGFNAIGIGNLRNTKTSLKGYFKTSSLQFLKNIEDKKKLRLWFFSDKSTKTKRSNIIILIVTCLIIAITFISRYYFILYDNYSLSDKWIYDLSKVIQFDNQIWFSNGMSVDGDYALINFYSKITDVSPEIALQVIAILESALLAIIIFWFIRQLSFSKLIVPIIASLSFALVYVLSPFNIYYLLKDNPIFMALGFILPAFVFYVRPELLTEKKLNYGISFVLAFLAIGLINIFSYCILIPPFMIIVFLLSDKKQKIHHLIAVFSYVFSTGVLVLIYALASNSQKVSLSEFIHANLLSVDSYTYVPQLILPYNQIINFFQISSLIGIAIVLILYYRFKIKYWKSQLEFYLYFNFLVFLSYFGNSWIDVDLINNAISIMLPLIFGFNCAIVLQIVNLIVKKNEKISIILVPILFISLLFSAIIFQEQSLKRLDESDKTPKQILDAYDKIRETYFPYSYSVVNDPVTQVISTNKHYFINYSFFLNDYSKWDSIYFSNKNNPKFKFLKQKYILPKSVLVFVLNKNNKAESNLLSENKNLNSSLDKEIALLKKRGRTINLFYTSDILKVYEIVNEPQESKISDLLF